MEEVDLTTTRRVTFKQFVAEANPCRDSIVRLKSHSGGKSLNLYLTTINDVLGVCPKLFKLQNNMSSEGVDGEIYAEEVRKYSNKKIVGVVKRFKGKVSVAIQLMFDEDNTGVYKHTQCQVQLSPEDDLEKLREFGQMVKRDNEVMTKSGVAGECESQTLVLDDEECGDYEEMRG